MRKFTFKRQLMFVMLMLLGCLPIQAADDGLITNQVIINLEEPGTLPQKISNSEKNLITNLKINGRINGTDLGFIREMAGQSINGEDVTDGKLSILDLSEAKIVWGGKAYYNFRNSEVYYVENENEIGNNVFSFCSGLKSITLPNNITSIGKAAFWGCSGLTNLTIPSTVSSISLFAFYDCSGLTSLTLSSCLTSIGDNAFGGCNQLEDVRYIILDDLATYIQTDHPLIDINCSIKYYRNNKELTTLKIPAGITSVGKNAFQKCSSFTSLTFPSAITSISDLHFNNVFTNLKTVYAGWQEPIAAGTFFEDVDINKSTLYVPHGTKKAYSNADVWKNFGNIVEFYNQTTINLEKPGTLPQKISDSEKNLITNLKIKGEINGTDLRFIREMAGVSVDGYETDGNLSNLDLSEAKIVSGGACYCQYDSNNKYYTQDDELGPFAFANCSGLNSFAFPASLKSIGNDAFRYCSSLKTLDLPSGLISIGDWAFYGCSGLTTLNLPSGLISIGYVAFQKCSSLTSLNLPSSLISIGAAAFAICDALTSITLHSNTTEIGGNAFGQAMGGCYNLKEMRYIIDSDLETYIQSNHPALYFYNCGIKYYLNDQEITSLEIPSSVTSIGDGVFCCSHSLTNLTLSSRVTSIGDAAFAACGNLKDVRYIIDCDLATYIQKDHPAFYVNCDIKYYWNNKEITTLEIPSSVTSIGNHAFYNCSGLTSVDIPSNVTSIGDWAFSSCRGLTSVDLPSSITKMGDFVFNDCERLASVNLPSGITAIGTRAFAWCTSLKSINLPSGITTIGKGAFSGCSSLQGIDFPSGITSIGDDAFEYCSGLQNINLPYGISSIGDYAFWNCSNLMNVTLSSNITSMGKSAFDGCNSLKNLAISNNVTSIKDICFNLSTDNLELESVYVAWQNPIEAGSFFDNIEISKCILYVPKGTKNAYSNADVWRDFANIIEYNATGVNNVTNCSEVKEIARYSLNGQRVTYPTKGMNIVVYSDGSIRKVVVR
ncbi:leucine-rich repeat domain-containing protein [Prevotella sp.]|uniref:leucine-rich repeat domain-containing protein n=1 Tax=Prevotella sp. TaxID=59823 RepID=UPI0027E27F77|nr:leucine-rich repeat domain-containing protein [Prevotella sp.]